MNKVKQVSIETNRRLLEIKLAVILDNIQLLIVQHSSKRDLQPRLLISQRNDLGQFQQLTIDQRKYLLARHFSQENHLLRDNSPTKESLLRMASENHVIECNLRTISLRSIIIKEIFHLINIFQTFLVNLLAKIMDQKYHKRNDFHSLKFKR
jgi:hypothetical protein